MNKEERLLLKILCLLLSTNVFAEILQKVIITGNRQSTASAIIRHGQIKIGQELNENDLRTIKENLGRIQQIQVKKLKFQDGILNIEVIDKWTFIPIPMITQSGDYRNYGIVIYDDNFLGTLGTFAPGISWSNSILNYLVYFQNESLFTPSTGIKLLFLKKSDFVEFKRSDSIIDTHEARYNSYLISPNFLYKDQVFKAGPIYLDKSIYKNKMLIFEDKSQGIFFRHHWNAFQALDILYEGFVTTFDLYLLKKQTGQTLYQNEASLKWCHPSQSNNYTIGIHSYISSDKSYLFAKNLGGEEGFRGYDKASLPVAKNIGSYIQYQKQFISTFYISPFYEYNYSKLINPVLMGSNLSESTLGISLSYYFKKISIPAVMFDTARNLDDKTYHFHINIGVSI